WRVRHARLRRARDRQGRRRAGRGVRGDRRRRRYHALGSRHRSEHHHGVAARRAVGLRTPASLTGRAKCSRGNVGRMSTGRRPPVRAIALLALLIAPICLVLGGVAFSVVRNRRVATTAGPAEWPPFQPRLVPSPGPVAWIEAAAGGVGAASPPGTGSG